MFFGLVCHVVPVTSAIVLSIFVVSSSVSLVSIITRCIIISVFECVCLVLKFIIQIILGGPTGVYVFLERADAFSGFVYFVFY
jgi:hypothetical protein